MNIGYFLNPVGSVTSVVKEWRPRGCKTEKQYEVSLLRALEGALPGKDIVKQYAVGRVRGDIVVEKKILIELKQNLNSTSKLQRLVGQIEIYKTEWGRPVILVLCGEHDTNLLRQVRELVRRKADASAFISEWDLVLVVK